jgi:hypothetical protein
VKFGKKTYTRAQHEIEIEMSWVTRVEMIGVEMKWHG